jgi:hypothetical protein
MLHLQDIIRGPLCACRSDGVRRTIEKRAQDEHVQRALEQICALLCLLSHGRRSTLNSKRW